MCKLVCRVWCFVFSFCPAWTQQLEEWGVFCCRCFTSRVNERTTSDLDSRFSSSWPMSIMEVLCPRFSFCSLNSPPLETGMLSRFAISRLTDERSSSMYMASISLETNLGNLPPSLAKQEIVSLITKLHPVSILVKWSKSAFISGSFLSLCPSCSVNIGFVLHVSF